MNASSVVGKRWLAVPILKCALRLHDPVHQVFAKRRFEHENTVR
jgi:hypothetical protein